MKYKTRREHDRQVIESEKVTPAMMRKAGIDPADPMAWEKYNLRPDDILVQLFDDGAYGVKSSVPIEDFAGKEKHLDMLLRDKRVVISGDKICLTGIGKHLALAELLLIRKKGLRDARQV